ncbi:uncharacterized protein LOC131332831 [Rhododendron vialii]|uniref:uncharacterized protein LOC131332831 n=1 Tax=Rhododendron vialii TaxID=182163 RepID=UPI00265D773B|nr:uncharacterized protein LOC131332831 [Rhododendron vialii]
MVQQYIISVIGNGHSTFLCYDNWHPLGPSMAKFGPRIAYDSGIPKEPSMAHMIHNSSWAFPITQMLELNEIKSSLPTIIPSRLRGFDNIRWSLTPNGQFTIASLWDKLRSPFPRVLWNKLIWFSGHIPKCSFITWIAIQNRLSTIDRLKEM